MGKKIILVDSNEAREKSIPGRILTKHLGLHSKSDKGNHVLVYSCEEIREGKDFGHLTKGDIIYVRFYGDEIKPMRFEGMKPWPGGTGEGAPTPLLQEIPPEEVKEDRIIGTLSIAFPHR
jgi:hypothetical protein